MKIVKPAWVCSKEALYTCDVHPKGQKFATGGQGENGNGKITIWNLGPVRSKKQEVSASTKHVAVLEHHQGCVNCVRWSHDGTYLASAGDDRVVMIWTAVRYEGSTSESYKCSHILIAHEGDVLDVAWSCDDKYLASTSIDNSVIIWNCKVFPERITTIKGHEGMVKGVVWDPIGRYLATQSTDRTLRVWRLADWREEKSITEPFVKCGGTTTVLRLGWSPDGQYLVSSHAMNNEGPVAKIIEREQWKARMDFVGHRRAIESVRFNPQLFYHEGRPVSCVALAGRDASVSVWLTSLKRPLFVVHDLFTSSVLDMSWTPDGYGLAICSLDGTLAYIELNANELGKSLTIDQSNSLKEKIYGNISQEKPLVIENPDLLDLGEEATLSQGDNGTVTEDCDTEEMDTEEDQLVRTDNSFGAENGSSISLSGITDKFASRFQDKPSVFSMASQSPTLNIKDRQVETKTSDGKRRIMPVTLKTIPISSQSVTAESKKRVTLTPVSNMQPSPAPAPVNNHTNHTIDLGDVPTRLSKRLRVAEQQPGTVAQSKTFVFKKSDKKEEVHLQEKLFAMVSDTKIEIDNKDQIVKFTTCSSTWCSALCSPVTCLVCDKNTLLLGCMDGSIHVLDSMGDHILPILNIGASVLKTALSKDYVAVVSETPTLYVWNIKTKKNVLKDESLISFSNPDRKITQITVSDSGHVIIGLKNDTSYCYDYDLAAWMLLAQDELDDAWYKELHSNTKHGPADHPSDTLLSSLHNLSSRKRRTVLQTDNKTSHKSKLNTIMLMEQQLLVSDRLHATSESRQWLSSLVRYLTLQNEETKLQNILQKLIISSEDVIFGSNKFEVIRDLLKTIASNVSLQRLYSDFQTQVEWAEHRK